MTYTKLIVGGFKSLRERTEIPLAPLTFLVGPNSAGKTAVAQVLKAFSERLKNEEPSQSFMEIAIRTLSGPQLQAHRLPLKGNEEEMETVPVLLGIEYDEFPIGGTHFDGYDAAIKLGVEIFWNFENEPLRLETLEASYGLLFRTELMAHGKPFITMMSEATTNKLLGLEPTALRPAFVGFCEANYSAFQSWGGCLISLDHPLVTSTDLGVYIQRLVKAAQCAKTDFCRKGLQLLDQSGPVLLLRGTGSVPYAIHGWGRASNDDMPFEQYLSRRSHESDGGGEAIKEIAAAIDDVDFVCRVVTFLLAEVASNVRDTLKVTHVDGMRSRLDKSDLTVQVDASSWRGAVTPLQHYACWLGARAAGIEPENARQIQFPNSSGDFINDVLGSGLFVDRQYAVKADVWRTTTEPLAVRDSSYDYEDQFLKMSLYLQDGNGRILDFGEVGSGVTYVLPVLAALWGSDRSWIEQPELHLHPAAQCALGDVFIRAFNRGRFAIVETHSEHLLLRVLRRIRQTTAGKVDDVELRCSPEAVSVLYFDPQSDGSTKVHQLRVTRGGDFMDRWPRGFFEEREQELFDE